MVATAWEDDHTVFGGKQEHTAEQGQQKNVISGIETAVSPSPWLFIHILMC